jgi:hypothetical protein
MFRTMRSWPPPRGRLPEMRYKLLGRTGLRVCELCLGAMVFGDQRGGWGASSVGAAAIIRRVAEAGGEFHRHSLGCDDLADDALALAAAISPLM